MFAGVGERTREGNDLYREMIESGACLISAGCSSCGWRAQQHLAGRGGCTASNTRARSAPPCHPYHPCHPPLPAGVIKLGDQQAESKVTLVYGQMNEPRGARARVALTGLTVAEYFRDEEGQDVLLFVDNIFRFTQVRCGWVWVLRCVGAGLVGRGCCDDVSPCARFTCPRLPGTR